MTLATTKPLPGLTRSTHCASAVQGTKSRCRRLAGHSGDHRTTLHQAHKPVGKTAQAQAPKGPKVAPAVVFAEDVMGFRIVVLADGTVSSTPIATVPAKAAKVRSVRSVRSVTRVASGGVEVASADRYTVQPTVIPMADSPRRVAATNNGRRGTKRAKAAPQGTKSRSNANALKGRISRKDS